MTWTLRRLDELGHVSRGRSRHRPRDAEHLYTGPYPFIQTGDVKHAELYITHYEQTYSEAGLRQSKLWSAGTLCITIAANIAETAILKFAACFPDSVIGFLPDRERADARFIKYLFDATIRDRLRQFTQGAAQDNLSQSKLLSIDFPVPDIRTQERIADVLSAYDKLIENNSRRVALLEDAVRHLYREWFVRLRFPGSDRAPLEHALPNGWKLLSVFAAVEILSGGTPKTSRSEYWGGTIPFFTPKDATPTSYVLKTERNITELGLTECNSRLYPVDTVFISARGTVGKLNLAARPMAMSQSCYALIGRPPVSQLFLFCALMEGLDALKQHAGGAVFDAIVVDTFKLIPFVVPTEQVVREFEEAVTPVFRLIANLISQNEKLRAARDLLLPRLMSGELAV